MIFAIFLITFVVELPESSRWLIEKDMVQEAREVLAALDNIDIDDHLIQSQIDEILATLVDESKPRSLFQRMFSFDKNRHFHRAMLAYWNQAAQQLTGIKLITYYAATQSVEVSNSCCLQRNPVLSWIAFYTIDRTGRRKLMLFGRAGQAATMAATVWDAQVNNTSSDIAAAMLLFVFNTFFAIG